MSASLDALIPELVPYARALVGVAGSAGLQPRVTSTRRSHQEQARLYRRFLAGNQKYPVAPPGSSAHEYGYAFDMVTTAMDPQDLKDLGQVWESWGGVWGGEFRDPIHFEYPGFTVSAPRSNAPQAGGSFYKLANVLSGFVPILGEVQLVDSLVSLLDGNDDLASWYLQHPAEAIRDLVNRLL
jgi:hypothetical protein